MPVKDRARDLAWSAYVWPKGTWGNACQGAVLNVLETRRVRREWARASRIFMVHTPGKVGSKALTAALRSSAGPLDTIFHTHRINPRDLIGAPEERAGVAPRRTWYTAAFLGKAAPREVRRPINILSAVRDPMERNLSAFFQNLERYTDDGRPLRSFDLSRAGELADMFVNRFPHEEVLGWVDRELVDLFGLDVYENAFDLEVGYQVLRRDNITCGVIRHDRLSDAGSRFVGELTGNFRTDLPRVNDSNAKRYGALQAAVRDCVHMPGEMLERLYWNPFAEHFFTEQERLIALRRWSVHVWD